MSKYIQHNQFDAQGSGVALTPDRPGAHRGPLGSTRLAMANEGAAVLSRPGDDGWEDNSLRPILGMLSRRRAIIFLTLVMVLAMTAVYLWLSPPLYEATATMQVHAAETNKEESSSNDSLVMSGTLGGDRTLETQLTIIESNQVRRAALNRLTPEHRATLSGYMNTTIEPIGTTNLISVKVASHDPAASAALANAYCDEYIDLSRKENRLRVQAALDYVGEQKAKVQRRLEAARLQLQRYKESNNLFSIDSEANSVIATAKRIEDEQAENVAQQAVARTEMQRISQLIPTIPKIKVWPGSTVQRPEIAAIRGQITNLEITRLQLLEKYRPDRPEVQTVDRQIESLRQRLEQEAKTEINTWSNQPDQIREGLEQQLVGLQVQNWSLQTKAAALSDAAERIKGRVALLPTRERQMSEMNLALEALQGSYSALQSKQEQLRMTQEAKVANATKLFEADPPKGPISRHARNLASSLLVGLLLALALAALVDWLDDGIYGEAEAKMVSHLPILAQIPQVNRGAQQSLTEGADIPTNDGQLAHLRENFRMLRTMIALSAPAQHSNGAGYDAHGVLNGSANGSTNGHSNGNTNGHANGTSTLTKSGALLADSAIRSIVITSSLPNEGKSVSASNLAIAAALSGEQVILVDCDLRHPGLHEFFDLSNDIGLTNVVAGTCTLDEALQQTRIPTLKVLTTGPVTYEPMQTLNSYAARELFEQIKDEADFIVVDTPPALVFAEAQVIAAMTDAMLLVISSQDAKKRELARTCDLLNQTGLAPLGVILNKLPAVPDSYYYTQYYQ